MKKANLIISASTVNWICPETGIPVTYARYLAVSQSGRGHAKKIFKREKNYIAVSMVVVLREFQGKGFMHRVLEQPFAEADKKDIPCVLDTDTSLKVKKYIRCGMKLVAEKGLKDGISYGNGMSFLWDRSFLTRRQKNLMMTIQAFTICAARIILM